MDAESGIFKENQQREEYAYSEVHESRTVHREEDNGGSLRQTYYGQ